MFDTAFACQIPILVQVSFEMELMVEFLSVLVVVQFIDRKVSAIEGSSGLIETIEAIDVTLRNLQAFAELQSFNDTGKWLYEHPLTADRSERAQLERLRRDDPEQFLQEYSNCCYNVRRYSRFVKDPKRKERRDSDLKLLREHRRRQDLYKSILQSDEEK